MRRTDQNLWFMVWLLILLPPLLLVAGCVDGSLPKSADTTAGHRDTGGDTVWKQNIVPDTSKRVSGRLPDGRFQIPTQHTPAPDLFVTLPEGYTIRETGAIRDDILLIFRPDDPNILDTTQPPLGLLRIFVGANPGTAMPRGADADTLYSILDGQPAIWRTWSKKLPDGSLYKSFELNNPDFFRRLSPEPSQIPLHLHLYVAGRDPSRVAELMDIASTISVRP